MSAPVPEIAFAVAMGAAAISDLRYRRIANGLLVTLLIGGLGTRLLLGGLAATGAGLLGAAVALAVLIVPFARRWIAAGDVKLMIAAGAWLGWESTLYAILYGMAAGGVLALVILAINGRRLRSEVRVNLTTALLSFSIPAVPARQRSQLVPMAVALGGAAVAVLLARGGLHV